jgi:hypothetical protein
MSVFLLYYRTAWNDYFSTTNPTNLKSQTYNSRQTPSNSSVYVSNCLFNSIVESNQGGALYCSSSVTYFLVESSSFFSCKTSGGYGGAIYFSNSGGQSVLHEVCGYDCCTTNSNDFQFAYILVNNAASSKNYVNYSSITRCVNSYPNSQHTMYLYNGQIYCPFVNSSMNKCYRVSGISCYPYVNSSSVTCSLTYSSFTDNFDAHWICIYLWSGGANFEMKSCNILRNSQGDTGSHGTFYTNGNVMIENSCILENKAPCIFTQTQSSYTITVSKCTLDKTTNNQNLVIQNTVTESFILALNHMSTRNCHSEYDSIGTLTPIIQSPSSHKKTICYYTCQQRNVVPLIGILILIFNFIHPYASDDLW